MEILIVAGRGRDPGSSHLAICCSTSYVHGVCLSGVHLPELWLPLLAGYYYTRWNTYRDPRDRSCTRGPRTIQSSLVEPLRSRA